MTIPPPAMLRIDVLRNGNLIGEHAVRLTGSLGAMRAEISVELAVGIGPVTLFRYTHSVREEWQDGQFLRMESRTNDDGTRHEVRAERVADGVRVQRGASASTVLPPGTISLTHWNYQCKRAPLINPQTGLSLRMTDQRRDAEAIDLGSGPMIRARRYALQGEAELETWYDDQDMWIALRSAGRDGSSIRYRRSA